MPKLKPYLKFYIPVLYSRFDVEEPCGSVVEGLRFEIGVSSKRRGS
jgi:hypothetical protein